jgi:hypothetical protein
VEVSDPGRQPSTIASFPLANGAGMARLESLEQRPGCMLGNLLHEMLTSSNGDGGRMHAGRQCRCRSVGRCRANTLELIQG